MSDHKHPGDGSHGDDHTDADGIRRCGWCGRDKNRAVRTASECGWCASAPTCEGTGEIAVFPHWWMNGRPEGTCAVCAAAVSLTPTRKQAKRHVR